MLFSIEVTSVYFAIRNYWRGFFSAVFGALMFRLMVRLINSISLDYHLTCSSFYISFRFISSKAYWFSKEGKHTLFIKILFLINFMKNFKLQIETLTAIYRTDYQVDFPYDPQELFIYALVG